MAKVRVEYKLTASSAFMSIKSIIFNQAVVVDLKRDSFAAPPLTYQSIDTREVDKMYIIFPVDDVVDIIVIASGQEGFGWEMELTFTILDPDTNLPFNPGLLKPFKPETIKKEANEKRNASFQTSVAWKNS
jgi:hypothetical protein